MCILQCTIFDELKAIRVSNNACKIREQIEKLSHFAIFFSLQLQPLFPIDKIYFPLTTYTPDDMAVLLCWPIPMVWTFIECSSISILPFPKNREKNQMDKVLIALLWIFQFFFFFLNFISFYGT